MDRPYSVYMASLGILKLQTWRRCLLLLLLLLVVVVVVVVVILPQLSCHSVAVVLTLVQTKQIRINIPKRNNTKNTLQKIQNPVKTSTHITKTHTYTPTHYKTS